MCTHICIYGQEICAIYSYKRYLYAQMEFMCINGSKSLLSRQSPSSVLFLLQQHGNMDFASDYSVRNKFLLAHTSQIHDVVLKQSLQSVACTHISKPKYLSELPVSICRLHNFAHATFCATVTDVVIWFVKRFPPFVCEIQASFEDDENKCT